MPECSAPSASPRGKIEARSGAQDRGLSNPHDLRRTVGTMLGELGFAAPHIVETTLLNHVSGHRAGVAGVYQRARYENECRAALDKWGKWVEALV